MDLNNKKRKGGVALASRRLGRVEKGQPLILGANKMEGGYNFAVEASEDSEVSLLLYKKRGAASPVEIVFPKDFHTGRVWALKLCSASLKEFEYNYKIDGEIVQDPYAYGLHGREHFGVPYDPEKEVRCRFLNENVSGWENETAPAVEYENMILYKLHVRGYTKLARKMVSHKGTFLGLTEMIPYWKELGINAIELMPAYEFCEVPISKPKEGSEHIKTRRKENVVNYWGYASGFYFSPKSAYCSTREPEQEFRYMIRELHKNGIACIMEFYFPEETDSLMALRALQFWRDFYHVDGFHVLGEGFNREMLLRDGILSGAKLIFQGFDFDHFYRGKLPARRCGAESNMNFLQDMRRFLKSDEGMVEAAAWHIRHNSENHGVINYMVCQDGFTMNDLVSYNYKHNEANGEGNQDGSSYNYSWNCGVEGPTRKVSVRQMRERQIKNAFLMMLLSQGVPMIYHGDEFGNSQSGNNNAYCQDNATGWTDWKGLSRNQGLREFVKDAIAFRKAHPVLHMPVELKGVDYLTKGFPDVSLHGERAWYLSYENTSRLLGMMYYGAYAREKEDLEVAEDDFIYIGYNFHWENRSLALPNLPEGMCWKKIADTSLHGTGFCLEEEEEYKKSIEIGPRAIMVLLGRQEAEKDAIMAPVAALQDHHEA